MTEVPESILCVYKSDRTKFFSGEGGEERLTREKLSVCGTERFFLGPRCKERLVREVCKNGYTKYFTGEKGLEVLSHLTIDPIKNADGSIRAFGYTAWFDREGRKKTVRQDDGGNLCVTYTGERGKEKAVGVHMPTDTYTGIKRRIDGIISEKNAMVAKEEKKKKASLCHAQEFLSQMEEDVAKGVLRENEFNRYARILASTIYGAKEVNTEEEGGDSAMEED
tara:strand:- start:2564 stop:3232 length:669 start_codon:yes stop_codon:yes gene_type:complete